MTLSLKVTEILDTALKSARRITGIPLTSKLKISFVNKQRSVFIIYELGTERIVGGVM